MSIPDLREREVEPTTRRTFRAALARTRLGPDELGYEVEVSPSLADRLALEVAGGAVDPATYEAAESLAEKLREVVSVGRPSRVALDADEAEQMLSAVRSHKPSRRALRVCRGIERSLGEQLELTKAAAERDAITERVRELAIKLVSEEAQNLSLIARQANVSRGTLYAWLKVSRKP